MSKLVTCDPRSILSSIHKAAGPLFLLPTFPCPDLEQDIQLSLDTFTPSDIRLPWSFSYAHGTACDSLELGVVGLPVAERQVQTSVRMVARDEPSERAEQVANGQYGSKYASLPGQAARGETHPFFLLQAVSPESTSSAVQNSSIRPDHDTSEAHNSLIVDNDIPPQSTQQSSRSDGQSASLKRWAVFMPAGGMIDTITNSTLADIRHLRQENINTVDDALWAYADTHTEQLCPDAVQSIVPQQGLLFQLEQARKVVHDWKVDERGWPSGVIGGSGVEMGFACPVVQDGELTRHEGSDAGEAGVRYDVDRGKWVEVDFQYEIRTRDPPCTTDAATE